ncbi:MAG: hypothetical protein K6F80_02575 [Oscillospiraceae bacterium]|nr:hypothetical protein [Oscillospiraceae bacterium]
MKPKRMLFLLLFLIVGEIAGSCLRVQCPQSHIWEYAFTTHGIGMVEGSFRSILTEELVFPLLWLLMFAVVGLTICAAPAALAIVFLHGMTLGAVLTDLYQNHAFRGFLTAVSLVMPYAVLQTLLFLTAAREAMRSSLSLRKTVFGSDGEGSLLRIYLLRFLVLGAGLAVLAAVQGLVGSRLYPLIIRRLIY